MGLGPIEFVIIAIIVIALFGPALIAFWLGFTLGRRSGGPDASGPGQRQAVDTDRPAGGDRPAGTTTNDSGEEHA